jgi:hypothetical protein
MPQCRLVALTTPIPGREEEYHDWYNNVHLPELVNMFNMEGAQRFELVTKLMGSDENQYLAIYEFEADDPGAMLAKMGEAAQGGKLTQSDAQDMGTTYTALFQELAPRVTPGT